MNSPPAALLVAAVLFLASPAFCLAQEEQPRRWRKDGDYRPDPDPEPTFPRLPVFDPEAAPPITSWDYVTAGPLEFPEGGALDLLFGAPDALVGGSLHAFSGLWHDRGRFGMKEEAGRPLVVRMLGAIDVGVQDRSFDGLMSLLYEREAKYLSRWSESPLATVGLGDGFDEPDQDKLLGDQRKIFTHTLGRYYLGRFGTKMSDSLRRDAMDFSGWHSSDYVIAPAVLAGYLYWRGWDGRINAGPLECRYHVLPLERIRAHYGRDNDYLVTAATMEFGVEDFPIKAIVSGGLHDGRPALEFVGLGTSVAMARKVVKRVIGDGESDR